MSMTRYSLLSLLAVVVAGLVVSAQAFGAQHDFLVEQTEIAPKESLAVEGTSKTSKFEGSVAKVKVVVKCEKDVLSASLEEGGAHKGTIEYKECKLFNEKEKEVLTSCKVVEPITAKFKATLIGSEESEMREPVEDKLSAQEGSELTKIEIKENEKKCIEAGKYSVTGSQICRLPNGEKEKTEHEIECLPSGSKLTLSGEKASLTSTDQIKLKSGKKFAAVDKAAILFEWRVNKVLLLNGEAKAVTSVMANGNLTITGVVNGTSFKFECNTVTSTAAPAPQIVGQKNTNFPDYLEIGLKISGCNNNVTPANCVIPEFSTVTLLGTLVEGINASAGRFLIAFKNDNENKLFEIKFEGGAACSLNGVTAVVGRNNGLGLLGEMPGVEKVTQEIKFEPAEALEAKYLFGALYAAGLVVEPALTNRVTLAGTITMKLTTGEAFRPN
jgi:hypothetical protein